MTLKPTQPLTLCFKASLSRKKTKHYLIDGFYLNLVFLSSHNPFEK